MAVPKRRISKARGRKRRSHNAIKAGAVVALSAVWNGCAVPCRLPELRQLPRPHGRRARGIDTDADRAGRDGR